MEAKKTALYDVHVKLGGKMVEFGGYMMPVQYKGITQEHLAVRHSVGIFDVSHMGEFYFSGPAAAAYLQKMTLNDVTRIEPYQAQYTAMCYEDGGMVDDLILYRYNDRYMTIVNAGNRQRDYDWMRQHLPDGVQMEDRSDEISLFAVQGRHAYATLQKLTALDLSGIRFYWFAEGEIAGVKGFVARTGYTGEDGFEVGVPSESSVKVWNAIMEAGAEFEIEPVGLGARDTLRLEMKYCLYGNDIDKTTNPIEAGLGWITKVDKGEFIGRDAIVKVKEAGPKRKLVGFELKDRGIPRHGYKVFRDGNEIGVVTSGTFSPCLGKGLGIAYIDVPHNQVGTAIELSVRGKSLAAEIVKTPFYQRPY